MEKVYIVVANDTKGKDNKPYSKALELKTYGTATYLDQKNPLYLGEVRPVGNQFKVELTVKAGA